MKYGLSPNVIKQITEVISQFPQVEETIIYGSRAKGNYKPSSDVDFTLKGNNLTLQQLNKVAIMLDDLLLPQKFDVSIYQHISNPDLLDQIARVGQRL
jgi:predicted nucleotidyltransferase